MGPTREPKDQPEATPKSAPATVAPQSGGKQRAAARSAASYSEQHEQLAPARQPGYQQSTHALKPDDPKPAVSDDGSSGGGISGSGRVGSKAGSRGESPATDG